VRLEAAAVFFPVHAGKIDQQVLQPPFFNQSADGVMIQIRRVGTRILGMPFEVLLVG
jgi:hypothetical protein